MGSEQCHLAAMETGIVTLEKGFQQLPGVGETAMHQCIWYGP